MNSFGMSLIGNDHTLAGKGNQDHYLLWSDNEGNDYLAIADGVGQQPYSDFASKFLLLELRRLIQEQGSGLIQHTAILEKELLTAYSHYFSTSKDALEYGSATFLLQACLKQSIHILGAGDGYWGINDNVQYIDNAGTPDIILYGLWDNKRRIQTHVVVDRQDVDYVWVASDGLGHWLDAPDNSVYPFSGQPILQFDEVVHDWGLLAQTARMLNSKSNKRPKLLGDDFTIAYANNF